MNSYAEEAIFFFLVLMIDLIFDNCHTSYYLKWVYFNNFYKITMPRRLSVYGNGVFTVFTDK